LSLGPYTFVELDTCFQEIKPLRPLEPQRAGKFFLNPATLVTPAVRSPALINLTITNRIASGHVTYLWVSTCLKEINVDMRPATNSRRPA
jgi:hypothetical protein